MQNYKGYTFRVTELTVIDQLLFVKKTLEIDSNQVDFMNDICTIIMVSNAISLLDMKFAPEIKYWFNKRNILPFSRFGPIYFCMLHSNNFPLSNFFHWVIKVIICDAVFIFCNELRNYCINSPLAEFLFLSQISVGFINSNRNFGIIILNCPFSNS